MFCVCWIGSFHFRKLFDIGGSALISSSWNDHQNFNEQISQNGDEQQGIEKQVCL
jgi:hypothetical protein